MKQLNIQTHIFNPRLFLEGLKRLKVIGICATILALTFSLLIPSLQWMRYTNRQYDEPTLDYDYDIFAEDLAFTDPESYIEASKWQYQEKPAMQTILSREEICYPLYLIPLVAPVFLFVLFSFLFKRKQADVFHAIPYTRTCVYLSFTLAALALVTVITALSALFSGTVYALCPYTAYRLSELVSTALLSLLSSFMLSAIMLLAVTLSGTEGGALFLFCLFSALPRILFFFFGITLEEIHTMIDIQYLMGGFLNPDYFLPLSFLFSLLGENSLALGTTANTVYSIVVTLLLFVAAGFCYKLRRSEVAATPAPNRFLQTAFRTLFALPFALCITVYLLMGEIEFEMMIVFLVLALLAYYLYELITTKRIRSMLRATRSLPILFLCCILFAGIFILTDVTLQTEDSSAENIRTVTVDFQSGSETYEDLMARELGCNDEQVKKIVSLVWTDAKNGRYESSNASPYRSATVYIRTKGGRMLVRKLRFSEHQKEVIEERVQEDQSYLDTINRLPSAKEIQTVYAWTYNDFGEAKFNSLDEVTAFMRLFRAEFDALSNADKLYVKTHNSDGMKEEEAGTMLRVEAPVSLTISGYRNGRRFSSEYAISDKLPKTAEFLFDKIVESTFSYVNLREDYRTCAIRHYGNAPDILDRMLNILQKEFIPAARKGELSSSSSSVSLTVTRLSEELTSGVFFSWGDPISLHDNTDALCTFLKARLADSLYPKEGGEGILLRMDLSLSYKWLTASEKEDSDEGRYGYAHVMLYLTQEEIATLSTLIENLGITPQ